MGMHTLELKILIWIKNYSILFKERNGWVFYGKDWNGKSMEGIKDEKWETLITERV